MKRYLFVIILFSVISSNIMAQLAMGQWRTHFAYSSVTQVAQTSNKIFAVSEGSLFSVDKYDENIEYYSKLSGLNGSVISYIEYDAENDCLVIVYHNGNIDLLRSGGVENISDLYKATMSVSKAVNSICFYNGKAYLSCDFGIVVLNIKKNEIAETYFIGNNATEVKVLYTAVHNGYIYAITEDAMYKANVNNSHLVNYEYWTTIDALPGSGTLQQITSFGNDLILVRGHKIYKLNEDNTWTAVVSDIWVDGVRVFDGRLLGYTYGVIYVINSEYTYTYMDGLEAISDVEYDRTDDKYWLAAEAKGVMKYDAFTQTLSGYVPNGPAVNIPYRMRFSGKKLFVVPGGRWAVQEARPGNVMMYENGLWTNIVNADIYAATQRPVLDFMNVAVDPEDNKHFFVTSFGTGLYEFKNSEFFAHYTQDNSIIAACIPDVYDYYTRLDGAMYDSEGNMWFIDIGDATKTMIILKKDGSWIDFNLYLSNSERLVLHTPGEMLIDKQNSHYKWIPYCRYQPGVVLFDDNGTIDNISDDRTVIRSVFFDQDNNSVKPEAIYCMAQDQDNAMWVGTNLGPIILSDPDQAFTSNFTCTRVKIPRNDGTELADFLLDEIQINAIAIDGANRKWIGTASSGIYLMSPNGQETIKHFTTSNSPLLSNNILSIAINPETGEVFIGTGSGLVSYQSDAVEGGDAFTKIYAYPNPVRETYTGLITITGLIANTTVKITDVAGNVVCETVSNGGLAVWDGKNKFGKRVSTGVYMAICLSEDGEEKGITKILVIN